jgi:hypothetical protein
LGLFVEPFRSPYSEHGEAESDVTADRVIGQARNLVRRREMRGGCK